MTVNSDDARVSLALFHDVIRQVPSDRWGDPSPCEGWSARDVLGHFIFWLRHFATVAADTSPGEVKVDQHGADNPGTVLDDNPIAQYESVQTGFLAALTDENLRRAPGLVKDPVIVGLISHLSGRDPDEVIVDHMVGIMARDGLIHAWDIGQAAGVDVRFPDELAERALKHLLPVDEKVRRPGEYGLRVEEPAGADIQTRLLSFTGRRVPVEQ